MHKQIDNEYKYNNNVRIILKFTKINVEEQFQPHQYQQ
jgi:hypothetical protein